ncbi:MAG: YkgJ family cysteine cluster protein [Planctomycetota bacterium]
MSYEAWRYRAEEGSDPYALVDEAVVEAPTSAAWACERGCAHCCWLLVEVTPVEADRLTQFVTPSIAARISANAAAAKGLTPAEYRMPCAFLDDDGNCAAYEARPLRCRAHVSASEPICRSVQIGQTPSGAVPGDPWLATVVAAIQRGLPGAIEELHAALLRRSESPRA